MTAAPAPSAPGASPAMVDAFDGLLLDLDGVVYIGTDAVPGAVDALERCSERGVGLRFVTNNASRRPERVADILRRLGVPVDDEQVATSATATARMLADRLAPGCEVLVVGGDGLEHAVREAGLEPVRRAETPTAVVVGFGPEVNWRDLAEATAAVRGGAWFVATNPDRTVPTPRGPAPGNGVFVEAIAMAAERTPTVVGKPEPALFRATADAAGWSTPLVVGDRLDTDIAAAHRAGFASLLVLTGVTSSAQAVVAPVDQRPTFIADELGALHRPAPVADIDVAARSALCDGWTARVESGRILVVPGPHAQPHKRAAGALAACALAWHPAASEWGLSGLVPDDVRGLDGSATG